MHSILLIDSQDIVRFALQTLVANCPALHLAGSATTLADGLRLIERLRPDLVICDLALADSTGLPTLRAITQAQQPRRTLVFSMQEEALYGPQALALGADGFVSKAAAHGAVLHAAIQVLDGDISVSPRLGRSLVHDSLHRLRPRRSARPEHGPAALTLREVEVLEQLGTGKSTKQIASALDLSVRTVDLHRSRIKSKLGFRTGAELIAYAAQQP